MWRSSGTRKFTKLSGSDLAAVTALVLAPTLLLFPCLFLGRALLPLDLLPVVGPFRAHPEMFPGWPGRPKNPLLDPLQQYWPWRKFACRWLLRGEVPLWNPHAFSGYPFLANGQSALLYPPNLLFLPFAAAGCVERGFAWSALFHLIAGGLLAFALLRRWGISSPAALFGALAFTFSGWRMAWLEYPTVSLWVVTWLPACILAVLGLSEEEGRGKWAFWLSLFVALTLLGGHLQIAAYVLFVTLCYAVYETARRRRPSLLAPVAAGYLGGLVLSAAQLLPTLELLGWSPRAGLTPLREVLKTAVPISEVGRLLSPDLCGNPADYNYIGPFNYLETCGYAGTLTFLLASLSIRRKAGGLVWFLAGLEFYLLLCAFGTALYFPLWLVLRGATAPGRLFAVHPLVLGALAAFGLDRVLKKEGRARWQVIGATVVGAIAVAHTLGAHLDDLLGLDLMGYVRRRVLATALLWAAGCAVLLLLRRTGEGRARRWAVWLLPAVLAGDLLSLGARFNPMPPLSYARAAPDCVAFVKPPEGSVKPRMMSVGTNFLDWFAPNLPTVWGLYDVNGSDSLVLGRYVNLLEDLEGGRLKGRLWLLRRFRARLLDALSVRYVLSAVPLASEGLDFVAASDMWVYKRESAPPRAFIARRVWVFSDRRALRNWLLSEGSLKEEAAFLAPSGAASGRGRAEIVRYEPNLVELRYTSPTGGALVLCDTCCPGWLCFVNGRREPVMEANLVVRAVKVPEGRGTAKFVYHPESFSCGLFLSLLAISALVGLSAFRATGWGR